MNNYFSKTLIRWSLAFVLFYGAILDLKNVSILFKFFDFYFIFLAIWLFLGKRIIWSAYLTFVTFAFIFIWKTFIFGFNNGFLYFSLVLISLSLIGLVKK